MSSVQYDIGESDHDFVVLRVLILLHCDHFAAVMGVIVLPYRILWNMHDDKTAPTLLPSLGSGSCPLAGAYKPSSGVILPKAHEINPDEGVILRSIGTRTVQ